MEENTERYKLAGVLNGLLDEILWKIISSAAALRSLIMNRWFCITK